MMYDVECIDEMIRILRDMKKDSQKIDKFVGVSLLTLTPKQAQKRNADAAYIGIAQIKRTHELHALAVEIGFGERRPHYNEIMLTDGWGKFKYKPREPK